MTRTALYPGSFDPVTNGHLDMIKRGSRLTDRLIVAVATNTGKDAMFSIDERLQFLTGEIAALQKAGALFCAVEVTRIEGLLVDFAKKSGAGIILRGLRAVTDFDYEFQMTGMNHRLNAEIETVFLMASEHHQFIASRVVKEVAMLGGDVSAFVPASVAKAIGKKFGR